MLKYEARSNSVMDAYPTANSILNEASQFSLFSRNVQSVSSAVMDPDRSEAKRAEHL